ncbi:MAG: pteridine reductase [Gammaproteobacteria bacterium]|nr:pteridine reductase [Gammaproteobacteria bacterium]
MRGKNYPNSAGEEARVVVITGGARRLGAAIARRLHGEGLRIIIHYRHAASEAEQLKLELELQRPNSVALIQGDLLAIKALPQLATAMIAIWGRLDMLVNNASTFYPTPLGSITEADWDDLLGSNLKAPLFLTQALAAELTARGGAVVNMVDIHAERPMQAHTVYCIAKAGLAMLTRSLARELGPQVRVNGIAPGAILWPEQGMESSKQEEILKRNFLQRSGTPEDIAAAVVFLLLQADYTSGHILPVDGGRLVNI